MQQLQPDTLLQGGRYKIIEILGQGGFGITYLAEHTALGKRVCIKEFFMKELNLRSEDGSITGLSEGTLSYNYAGKFRKEAMNLAGMEHPNIVRVTDSFDENGTFHYVMDYIEGQNLNEYIKDHALSESEAIYIIKDVANALMYMHEQKHMLHLDLKPGNIMRRASDGHIFLIDFGLSKHYDKNGTPETSTTIGGGTPGYAPTEQGDKAKDGEFRPTIDVYALGATLFKLLTRETPPTASEVVNDDEILAEKLSAKGVALSVIDLVVKAMMPGYKKRIQTVKSFIDILVTCNKHSDESSNSLTDDENTIVGIGSSNGNTPTSAKTDNEETLLSDESTTITDHPNSTGTTYTPNSDFSEPEESNTLRKILYVIAPIVLFVLVFYLYQQYKFNQEEAEKARFEAEMEAQLEDQSQDQQETNDYECVDLGLSVKWSTCNLGAANPWDFGDYFAWGAVEPNVTFDDGYSLYNIHGKYNIINTDRDAAKQILGNGWRLPSYSEFEELSDNCTWEWAEWNGILGYQVTGKNGNSIFLPAGGYKDNNYGIGTDGFYWSGELYRKEEGFAKCFNFNESYRGRFNTQRSDKMAIRPVCD